MIFIESKLHTGNSFFFISSQYCKKYVDTSTERLNLFKKK